MRYLAAMRIPARFSAVLASLSLAAVLSEAPAAAAGRLDAEVSPYLQLHADDPVDWWPWGQDALAEARRADRPILLSIGYLACHWCHVMQEESYRDPDTAAAMNAAFVNVIVDREELPHIDAFYQQAAAAMELQTGWPLHVFLTPDGHPFFAGVYFPPQRRQGVPAFREVLAAVAETYAEQPADVAAYAGRVFGALAASRPSGAGREPPSPGELRAAWKAMVAEIDPFDGGFGKAAKYPYVPALETLWRAWLRTGGRLPRGRRADRARHGRGRHLRSPGRRLHALCRGSCMVGPAF